MLEPLEVGCSSLVVMLKEETKGKKIVSGISPPLPPLSFLSYLVIGCEAWVIKGGEEEKPQSSKDRL